MSTARFVFALLVLALLLVAGCTRSGTYDVQGRVMGFSNDPHTVVIAHEDVPGLMPAMTMSFTARSPEAVARLQTGDAVGFTLHVGADSAWIDGLERLPDSAVAAHPAGTPPPSRSADVLLEAGDRLPPFRLVDQQGDTLRATDFRGKALALTFIYTRCPLPDYCPLMSERFRALQTQLKEQFPDRAALLSISFDPEYDTPAVLKGYARRYDADPSLWHVATGAPEVIERLTARFGVFYQPQGGPEGAFVHNLTTAVVGPDGRLRRLWHGDDWTPEAVLRELAAALEDE